MAKTITLRKDKRTVLVVEGDAVDREFRRNGWTPAKEPVAAETADTKPAPDDSAKPSEQQATTGKPAAGAASAKK